MAIAGLGTYQSSSMYYTSNCNVENFNPNGKFFNQKMSFLMKNGDVVQNDDGSRIGNNTNATSRSTSSNNGKNIGVIDRKSVV